MGFKEESAGGASLWEEEEGGSVGGIPPRIF